MENDGFSADYRENRAGFRPARGAVHGLLRLGAGLLVRPICRKLVFPFVLDAVSGATQMTCPNCQHPSHEGTCGIITNYQSGYAVICSCGAAPVTVASLQRLVPVDAGWTGDLAKNMAETLFRHGIDSGLALPLAVTMLANIQKALDDNCNRDGQWDHAALDRLEAEMATYVAELGIAGTGVHADEWLTQLRECRKK